MRNIYARTVGKRITSKLRQGEFNRQLAEFLRETNRQVVADCAHIRYVPRVIDHKVTVHIRDSDGSTVISIG